MWICILEGELPTGLFTNQWKLNVPMKTGACLCLTPSERVFWEQHAPLSGWATAELRIWGVPRGLWLSAKAFPNASPQALHCESSGVRHAVRKHRLRASQSDWHFAQPPMTRNASPHLADRGVKCSSGPVRAPPAEWTLDMEVNPTAKKLEPHTNQPTKTYTTAHTDLAPSPSTYQRPDWQKKTYTLKKTSWQENNVRLYMNIFNSCQSWPFSFHVFYNSVLDHLQMTHWLLDIPEVLEYVLMGHLDFIVPSWDLRVVWSNHWCADQNRMVYLLPKMNTEYNITPKWCLACLMSHITGIKYN